DLPDEGAGDPARGLTDRPRERPPGSGREISRIARSRDRCRRRSARKCPQSLALNRGRRWHIPCDAGRTRPTMDRATLIQEPAMQTNVDTTRYAKCIETSKRIR